MRLARETTEDWWEVEALLDLSFAPGREALSSYRLREGVAPLAPCCIAAREEGALAGCIRAWPVRIGGARAVLVGPVAVHPTHQGEGLGGLLVRTCMRAAREAGETRAMLVGDAPYYGRFGFARLEGVTMPPPTNPERVLGLALSDGAWHGVAGAVERAA